jgi:hypothetical protein
MLLGVLVTAGLIVPVQAAGAPKRWPPVNGPGQVHVHFGEEHVDDADGDIILPKVVADSILFAPDVVVMSGDKSSNGTEENLLKWKEVMTAYDRAGIPYFAGLGNHDRAALPGFPNGISPLSPLGPYPSVFADRPYPFGDAAPPQLPGFSPATRPESDPAGASSHYAFDLGNVRWIVVDNSCYEFSVCDRNQNPPYEGGDTTFGFITQQATEAQEQGKLAFVSLHMPTQDPRPEHSQPTPFPHTFGEGASAENARFEEVAKAAGVDGVFAGHIKGQWIYQADDIPYFIDGGAGGEVYVGSDEEVGVDYGYWHGFRIVRVDGAKIVSTDAVPVFVPGGITVTDIPAAKVGDEVTLEAFGKQPTVDGPMVDKLQLRSPDPERPNAANLPEPARIWTSSNPRVARAVAVKDDDPRRRKASQTKGGTFKAVCPGRSRMTITSGVESASKVLTVASAEGPILRSVSRRGGKLRVRLAQPAQVEVRAGGKLLRRVCFAGGAKAMTTKVPRGKRAVVTIRSDRKPVVRRR